MLETRVYKHCNQQVRARRTVIDIALTDVPYNLGYRGSGETYWGVRGISKCLCMELKPGFMRERAFRGMHEGESFLSHINCLGGRFRLDVLAGNNCCDKQSLGILRRPERCWS